MTTLLIILNICHLLGDYSPLSTPWMLKAKRTGDPLFPIAIHALVHTILMAIAMWILGVEPTLIFLLSGIQWTTHFLIDVFKGKLNVWFPMLSNPANKSHWMIFGTDQFLHQAVIITMAYVAYH